MILVEIIIGAVCAVFVIVLMVGALLNAIYGAGYERGRDDMREEAAKLGLGRYEFDDPMKMPIPNACREPEWFWKGQKRT